MRPKKRVLLIDANPDRAATQRFTLEINRWRVLSATNSEEALAHCNHAPDVVLIVLPFAGAPELMKAIRRAAPQAASLAISQTRRTGIHEATLLGGCIADGMLYANTPQIELLERLKVLAARKRGPQPKTVQSVPAIEAEARRTA